MFILITETFVTLINQYPYLLHKIALSLLFFPFRSHAFLFTSISLKYHVYLTSNNYILLTVSFFQSNSGREYLKVIL